MFGSLEKLKQRLLRPPHAYRPTTESFPDIDVQRIATDMRLAEKGEKRGRENLPQSDDLPYDAVENDIIELVGAAQKQSHDHLENQLAGFRQRLIDLDFESRFANIKAASTAGLSDLKAELRMGIDDLHGLRRDLKEAESWHRDFKDQNGLRRPCKKTTAIGTTLKWLFVVALVMAELVINGELLAKRNELGLVGGIVEALIFAILNVGVALMFALYGVREIAHRSIFRKFVGILAIAAYIGAAIAINLGLAHYREVAGTIATNGDEVMRRLLSAPFALNEFRSWILFFLGVMFSLFALIDGLSMRDTYPGYATVDHRLDEARANYRNKRQGLIGELSDVRSGYEDELADARADLSKQRTEHDAIVAHRSRLVGLFDAHQAQLERAANSLFRIYRDANIAARTTPAPERFSRPYQLGRIGVQYFRDGEWNSDELQASIKDAQGDLDKMLVGLGEQFEAALKQYRELDVLVPEAQ
ncbi:hypothetical protein [Mesorhizobium sp. BR1-1-2]|uniref:hypothetical protein n=1 Tax=Mesorhizobium sp. BR1-1-2 TaxID=2876652 RepID=UPI001CC968BF|nr:hypothetical protein [Mesorhizobium sp. BR1-1-2]MBZ9962682.1 hypothetical protein [Mesorhizobium sp. BR1-1-2]